MHPHSPREPSPASPHKARRRPHSPKDWEDLLIVGWQELAGLPELGVDELTVKLDSGAVSSSLHAEKVSIFRRHQADWVRFEIGSGIAGMADEMRCEAPLLGFRRIQSSSGHRSVRPVIETTMSLAGFYWTIQLTLANRPTMQFPLLVGRDALAGRCLVDCGQTFLATPHHSTFRRS